MGRTMAVLAVVGLLVVAGCAGSGGEQLGADGAQPQDQAAATGTPAAAGTEAEADAGEAVQQNRQLIRTANVEVRVERFERARDRLSRIARRSDGFVGDETRRLRGHDNRTWTEGEVTLRVPANNYSAVIAAINDTGQVVAFEQRTQDVTNQIVDLQARLENLRAERDRLRTLFAQANDTEDVLAVEERLSDVQTEIERTEARLEQLRRQVALATITVRIVEPRPTRTPTPESQWYDTSLGSAFTESVGGVVIAARALAVFGAYSLPYLLAFGLPLVGLVVGLRRMRSGSSPDGSGRSLPTDSDTGNPPARADEQSGKPADADRSDTGSGQSETSSASDEEPEK